MKTNVIKMTLLVFIACTATSGWSFTTGQKAESLEKANANVETTSLEMDPARVDSAEYANYKVESEKKLKVNELLIADIKDKIESGSEESIAISKVQLDSLSMRNSQLRNNMQHYNSEGKANWEIFKKGFNKELESLGKDISQLAERNTKRGF